MLASSSLAWRTARVAVLTTKIPNQRATSGITLPGNVLTFSPMKATVTAETARMIPQVKRRVSLLIRRPEPYRLDALDTSPRGVLGRRNSAAITPPCVLAPLGPARPGG